VSPPGPSRAAPHRAPSFRPGSARPPGGRSLAMSRRQKGPPAAFDTGTSGAGAERAGIVPAAPAVEPAESEPTEAIAWLVDLGNHLVALLASSTASSTCCPLGTGSNRSSRPSATSRSTAPTTAPTTSRTPPSPPTSADATPAPSRRPTSPPIRPSVRGLHTGQGCMRSPPGLCRCACSGIIEAGTDPVCAVTPRRA
jgi:hypothetical protein